jgi:hypothetical protein
MGHDLGLRATDYENQNIHSQIAKNPLMSHTHLVKDLWRVTGSLRRLHHL